MACLGPGASSAGDGVRAPQRCQRGTFDAAA